MWNTLALYVVFALQETVAARRTAAVTTAAVAAAAVAAVVRATMGRRLMGLPGAAAAAPVAPNLTKMPKIATTTVKKRWR